MLTPAQLTARYGNPVTDRAAFAQKWVMEYVLPIWLKPVFPKCQGQPVTRIYLHTACRAAFEAVMQELVTTGLIKELKTYDGCWVIRNQRGSNVPSVHSWALAFDFNAATNPLGGRVTFSAAFLAVWRKHGFICGADFKGARVDGMHFEFTRS